MTQIARVYGDSLYELAAGEGLSETIRGQMEQILTLFRENPDYIRLLSEPSLPKETRVSLIEEAFAGQAERYLINFLKLLCERGILSEYADCCEEFKKRYYADHNMAEAIVTSAVPLRDDQMTALKEKLSDMTGKEIILVQKTDPSLLAGLRVEIEGKQLDGSVQRRLTELSRQLNEIIV